MQGVVDPRNIFRKGGARPGDIAILSKPIGTGLVTASGTDEQKREVIAGMRTLNKKAAEDLRRYAVDVHAVTDVTGYGLAGHGWEMAERSGIKFIVDTMSLPLYSGAHDLAVSGARTGGDARNRSYVGDHAVINADETYVALCMDPQTSGGLLAAVAPNVAHALVSEGMWVSIGSFESGTPVIELR